MDTRFATRRQELLEAAVCSPTVTAQTLDQLDEFLKPYAEHLAEPEQRAHTTEYVQGLLSSLESKTGEGIAYLHDQNRQGIQKFLGQVPWDHTPLITTLATQVAQQIGEADAVLVFDPSAFPKKGPKSVGVQRQWCGRLGKTDNCQVGVFLGYVSRHEHTLVDFRLYLPKEWTNDRKRRREAGVPKGTKFRTRHELALAMLDEHGGKLPHGWISGDDEMGRPAHFRQELRARNERYVLAVPSNTVVRNLEVEPPAYSGRGRRRERPFIRVDRWREALPESAWTRIEVRDGSKGPLATEAVMCRVRAKLGRSAGPEERLFVTREQQSDGKYTHDYYLAHAGEAEVSLAELARVAKAEHRIEECLQRAKSEAGLGDYQVRTWMGWHHHLTLSLLAVWFLVGATRRGKNADARVDGAAGAEFDREPVGGVAEVSRKRDGPSSNHALVAAKRIGTSVSLQAA
jgi:SRSO17 transposase